MIQNTFTLLQGIGEKTEQRLWAQGILCWDDFLKTPSIAWMGAEKKHFYDSVLKTARTQLQAGNSDFFLRVLRPRDHWRLFQDMREYAVALDIETSGYTVQQGGYVTMVGLYDGFDYRPLVRGDGLDKKQLSHELAGYKYLITFFGTVFDLPFLKEALGFQYAGLHFDLCFAARRAGIKGGLKKLEQLLGIPRDESVKGFDGFDAVRLWNAAERGSSQARELLEAYNRCDTVNLFELADILYYMLRAQTGVHAFMEQSALQRRRGC